jgi:hypothetical protein
MALAACLAFAGPTTMQAQTAYGQPQGWHGVLSAQDQQEFDKDYAKWVNATRRQDQDDIASEAQHMQEIMSRYNIPAGVPFDQVASTGTYSVYPNQANPQVYTQIRLSPEDQRKFDQEYAKWADAESKGDQHHIDEHARNMEQIMARYNIPANVPFQAIASPGGVAVVPNGAYAAPYGYSAPAQRLSPEDQKNFDKAYRNWVKAERKRDIDDINGNARKMQEIMARYNIPANVPFDQVASAGALAH